MNISIDVVRESADGMQRETWRFTAFEGRGLARIILVPNHYWCEFKKTARHKLKVDPNRSYNRLGRARDGLNDERRCPLPDDVAAEAVEKLKSLICVRRWSDVAGKV